MNNAPMWLIKNSTVNDLDAIAECQIACFPSSFGVMLGKQTVAKSLDWFLKDKSRFLVHIEEDGKVVGFLGGFVPRFIGDGAKSGMFRHSRGAAMKQFLRNPLLLFHREVRKYAPAFIKNAMLRMRNKLSSPPPAGVEQNVKSATEDYTQTLQLVVIGVHPSCRRKGFGQALLKKFEEMAAVYNKEKMQLSVKQNNAPAIEAYKKAGWHVAGELQDTYFMRKLITHQ